MENKQMIDTYDDEIFKIIKINDKIMQCGFGK